MDISQTISGYITKMMSVGDSSSTAHGAKMKVLLLDKDTLAIVSTATTQSTLLNHDIFLTDRIDNVTREKMRHLRCLCFIRPSPDSINFLIEELRDPRYFEYYIYFSNTVLKSSLERLAEADHYEVVKCVKEYFLDYLVINPDFVSVDLAPPIRPWGTKPELWNPEALQRCTEAVVALLLSLKKKPLIRYAQNSLLCKKLGTEVRYYMTQEEKLFEFHKPDTPPILLIVDRRDDPVTPLLTQWTYQAMVHEMLGIKNGRVDLSHVPDVRPELKEIVLQKDTDPFFAKNMYLNYGDLALSARDYVEQYSAKSKATKEVNTVAEMKQFVEAYPEFRKLASNVTKHITLVGELSRRIPIEDLMNVSQLEQSLACDDNHTQDLKTIQQLIGSATVLDVNKLRLVALYALRYHKSPNSSLAILSDLLKTQTNLSSNDLSFLRLVLTYHNSLTNVPITAGPGGVAVPPPLFTTRSFFADARSSIQTIQRGLKGVENVLTKHVPKLETTLQDIIKGSLKEAAYPFIEGGGSTRDKPQDIIVFMVGGATYEEARSVAGLNASTPGVRIVLGGSSTLNSEMYINDVKEAVTRWGLETDGLGAEGRIRASLAR